MVVREVVRYWGIRNLQARANMPAFNLGILNHLDEENKNSFFFIPKIFNKFLIANHQIKQMLNLRVFLSY